MRHTLGVTVEFDSAHRLYPYEGKCANIHGHRYRLEVSLSGELDEKDLVVDFGELKFLITDLVNSFLDHKLLLNVHDPILEAIKSSGVEYLVFGRSPTAEVLASFLFVSLNSEFNQRYPFVRLEKVRLYETPTCYAEVGL
jgi:6-pyruvoyltetrahydropterin/6-carboxytetrahydropterin synthase